VRRKGGGRKALRTKQGKKKKRDLFGLLCYFEREKKDVLPCSPNKGGGLPQRYVFHQKDWGPALRMGGPKRDSFFTERGEVCVRRLGGMTFS